MASKAQAQACIIRADVFPLFGFAQQGFGFEKARRRKYRQRSFRAADLPPGVVTVTGEPLQRIGRGQAFSVFLVEARACGQILYIFKWRFTAGLEQGLVPA